MSDTRHKAGEYVYGTDGREGHWLTGEKITRCHNCIHYKPDPDPIDPGWPMWCEDSGRDIVHPDSFCSWGEERTDGQDTEQG